MRITTPLLFALTFVGTAAAATLTLQAVDNTKFPDLFASLRGRAVAAAKVDLAQAIAAAEKASSGKAASATLVGEGDTAAWDVATFAGETEHRVKINASTGAVESNTPAPAVTLPGDAVSTAPQKSASGLVWYDLKVGDGAQPAGPTTTVKVHYTGWLLDGRKFDSSHDRNAPIDFPLNGVIKGWTEGVGSMKVGGKRKLVIPAGLGYGPRATGIIPANGVLIFDVELLEIVK